MLFLAVCTMYHHCPIWWSLTPMWMVQLQDAKDMECLGWLLYLAEEFKCEALWHEIQHLTGVDVELTYWVIDGDNPHGSKLQTKAIDLEINSKDSNSSWQSITKLYSSASNMFPLDIRMCIVPEYGVLTNGRVKDMFRHLQDTQQCFLNYSKTCITQDILTLNLG